MHSCFKRNFGYQHGNTRRRQKKTHRGRHVNKELTKQLFEKYPKIFKDHARPNTESLMCEGFRCDEGWYNLIDSLCATFDMQRKFNNRYECTYDNSKEWFEFEFPVVVAVQVKEKYAKLAFYYRLEFSKGFDNLSKKFPKTGEHLARMARAYVDGACAAVSCLSQCICEITGKPGSVRKRGVWYKTLCQEETEKWLLYERKEPQ